MSNDSLIYKQSNSYIIDKSKKVFLFFLSYDVIRLCSYYT